MTVETIIILTGWGAISSVWFGLIVAQRRARRDGLFLEGPARTEARPEPRASARAAVASAAPSDHTHTPSVCVVIAARNESEGLACCLQHVLAQDYPNLSVKVIDDRSEDDTYAIAQALAQADPRIHAERVEHLPPKWMGKSHALWQGTRDVEADWLLFMDVDCALKPHAVSRAVQEARERHVDLLTLWPQQAAGGFWEHATIPLCGGIIALWFGARRANDPRSARAFANGQFLLFQRAAYQRIGGHEAVGSALIEDIPLAEHARDSQLACWVASGRELVSVRMYENYGAIVNGWARIYVGALRSGTKIVLSILWLLLGSLLPYVAGVALLVAMYADRAAGRGVRADHLFLAAQCVNHLTLMMIASYRFWGMGGCRRIDLIWYPLSVCVVVRILAQSWWWLVIRRSIPWRNTRYAIDGKGRIIG